jgi:hypothetical protein
VGKRRIQEHNDATKMTWGYVLPPCYSDQPKLNLKDMHYPKYVSQGLSTNDKPTFVLFSIAFVSTSPEIVMSDLGRHSCWTRALAMP